MPTYKTGFSGIFNNLSPKSSSPKSISTGVPIVGRVTDIILDENHPRYKEVDLGTNGIGVIFFELVGIDNAGGTKTARPYFPNIKNYPLINEFVYCFYLPVPTEGASSNFAKNYYYLTSFNMWSNPHFNALPSTVKSTLSTVSTINNYQNAEIGAVKIKSDEAPILDPNSPLNPSQDTFVEKDNIHPLMPFAGDVIFEGRFGNSIRLGNTAKSKTIYNNNWSTSGNNGDPITILRNGQSENIKSEGWIPITENIKNDLSSIYLTSYQKLPFNLANENFTSYLPDVISPSSFTSPQIILNSNRVVINAKSDSILISGDKSIVLSSNTNTNIDSPEIILSGREVKLGGNNASQPALKGDDTVTLLKQLVTEVKNLAQSLQSSQIYPGGVPSPDPVVGPVASNSLIILNKILARLDDDKTGIKSNFVKVK
jgi:hypothetical protein